MTLNIEPSASELARREQMLRDEILNRGLGGSRSEGPNSRAAARPMPPSEARHDFEAVNRALPDLDPEHAGIVFVDLVSSRVVTTLGRFELTDQEKAQVAFIALEAVKRNMQAVLTALSEKYGIPELQDAIAKQQEMLQEQFAKASGRVAGPVNGEATPKPEAVSFAEVEDEIDEENDLPPTPINRPLRRRNR